MFANACSIAGFVYNVLTILVNDVIPQNGTGQRVVKCLFRISVVQRVFLKVGAAQDDLRDIRIGFSTVPCSPERKACQTGPSQPGTEDGSQDSIRRLAAVRHLRSEVIRQKPSPHRTQTHLLETDVIGQNQSPLQNRTNVFGGNQQAHLARLLVNPRTSWRSSDAP